MSELRSKVRHTRIEHSPPKEIHDDTGHLWAVSYADLLMVLLSFFVVFFSIGEKEKTNLIQKITIATRGVSSVENDAQASTQESINAVVRRNFANVDIIETADPMALVLQFSQDLFSPGSIQFSAEGERALKDLLSQLEPFMNDINLTIVGHTDLSPIKHRKSYFIRNNFDLSVLRASRALSFFSENGWAENKMQAKGSGSFESAKRSLTIEVKVVKGAT